MLINPLRMRTDAMRRCQVPSSGTLTWLVLSSFISEQLGASKYLIEKWPKPGLKQVLGIIEVT